MGEFSRSCRRRRRARGPDTSPQRVCRSIRMRRAERRFYGVRPRRPFAIAFHRRPATHGHVYILGGPALELT